MQAAQTQVGYLEHPGRARPTSRRRRRAQPAPGRSSHEAKIKAKSAKEQIEIIEEQHRVDGRSGPRSTGSSRPGRSQKNLLGRPVEIGQELISIADLSGDWVLEVDVPDDDMGPVLAAQSKLEQEIARGQEDSRATRSRPTS